MEEGDRLLAGGSQPAGQLLRQGDRAVVATGAAERHHQARLPFRAVPRQGQRQQLLDEVEEAPRGRLGEDPARWKRYRGGRAQDVWTYDLAANTSQRLTDNPATDDIDIPPPPDRP